MKNIDIDIDMVIFENIDIDIEIDKANLKNIDIDIDKEILVNIDIDIDIDKEVLEKSISISTRRFLKISISKSISIRGSLKYR